MGWETFQEPNFKPFFPGGALANRPAWQKIKKEAQEKLIMINGSASEAIETGLLNMHHREVFSNKEQVVFNNVPYKKYQALLDDYKNRNDPNYGGTKKYERECDKLVFGYNEIGIVREAKSFEIPLIQINPIDCKQVREGKFSLIVHWLGNARYNKPECSFVNILDRGRPLIEAEGYTVADLKSCYHQFPLDKRSVLSMGFKYKNKIYVCQTLMYGPACAPFLVNTLNNMACLHVGLNREQYGECFIHDVLVAAICLEFIQDLKDIGYIFSPGKQQVGTKVTYTGIVLDCVEKQVEIAEKTYHKIQGIKRKDILKNEEEDYYIEFDNLQILMGSIVHCARTSPTGLLNAHYLLAKLAEGYQEQGMMLQLKSEHLQELNFWTTQRQILPMKLLKTTGVAVQILCKNPNEKPNPDGTVNCSDASNMYWAAKVNGKSKCGTFPVYLRKEPISAKEMWGHYEGVKMCEDGQRVIFNNDNTNVVAIFDSKRSKNWVMNDIMKKIMEEMKKRDLIITVRWVSTTQMASEKGADAFSRRNFSEIYDPNALSEEGVQAILTTFGKIHVDVFASSENNPFKTSYCSTLHQMDDKLNLQYEGIGFLTSNDLRGRLWLYMPEDLTIVTLKIVEGLDWENKKNDLQILMLVRQKYMKDVIGTFWHLRSKTEIGWTVFYKEGEKSKYLKMKTKCSLVLVSVGKYLKYPNVQP